MTDELELLLREEQEEPEMVPELLTVKVSGVPAARGGMAAAEEETEENAAAAPVGEWSEGAAGHGREVTVEENSEKKRGAGSAQTLYRTLMRTRQAVQVRPGYPVDKKMPLVKEPEYSFVTQLDVLRLDRAFQRDARRYDGGFAWQ